MSDEGSVFGSTYTAGTPESKIRYWRDRAEGLAAQVEELELITDCVVGSIRIDDDGFFSATLYRNSGKESHGRGKTPSEAMRDAEDHLIREKVCTTRPALEPTDV